MLPHNFSMINGNRRAHWGRISKTVDKSQYFLLALENRLFFTVCLKSGHTFFLKLAIISNVGEVQGNQYFHTLLESEFV